MYDSRNIINTRDNFSFFSSMTLCCCGVQLLVETSRRAMQACDLSQRARDVTCPSEFLRHDLTSIIDRLEVVECAHVIDGFVVYYHGWRVLAATVTFVIVNRHLSYFSPCQKCYHWLHQRYYYIRVLSTLRSSLRLAATINYVEPRLRTKFGETASSFAGSHVWNQLPAALRATPNLDSFKKQLKTHLFYSFLSWIIFFILYTFYSMNYCNAPLAIFVKSRTRNSTMVMMMMMMMM